MMRALYFASLITLAVCWFGTEQIHAQPLFPSAESIESSVANADLVCIAKIVKLGNVKQVETRVVCTATIDIEQTLKMGLFQDEPYQQLGVQVARPESVLKDWLERSCRLLILYDHYAPSATKVIELAPGKMEIFRADFTLLREPEDVIRAAKDALQQMSPAVKRIHTFRLHIPDKIRLGQGHTLSVPVDESLEKTALEHIHSEIYLVRMGGARALRYFKSETSIARLKPLLNDPDWSYLQHPQENNGIEVRIYGVRQEAYKTLKSWGLNVDKPMIREEIARSPKTNERLTSRRRRFSD